MPPAALVQPLKPEPVVPAVNDDVSVGGYIVGLRDFACEARVRFNALRAWALGIEPPDPNAGRCSTAGVAAAPPTR